MIDSPAPYLNLSSEHSRNWVRRLIAMKLIPQGTEPIDLTIAGEGNMNVVMRLNHTAGSCIIKQSHPFVAKYPTIAAPVERIHQEWIFYSKVAQDPFLRKAFPTLLDYDEESHTLLLEDLGTNREFAGFYSGRSALSEPDLGFLAQCLRQLHATALSIGEYERFRNREMRELNHAHIFDLPFRKSAPIDLEALTPGLEGLRKKVVASPGFAGSLKIAGDLYLEEGPSLLHGDFFPGSFLRSGCEVRIIDPEFSFAGHREWDWAVLRAHLMMACDESAERNWSGLAEAEDLNLKRLDLWTGIEILRRILGVAQLPEVKDFDLKTKEALIMRALSCLGT